MALAFLRHAAQKPPAGPLRLALGDPLTKGLVLAAPMTEYGSGTLNNLAGQQSKGTFTGPPTWGSGKLGAQLTFNGTTAFVDFGASVNARTTQNLSIAAWIQHTGAATARALVGWQQTTAGIAGYEFRLTTTNALELLRENNASLAVSASTAAANVLVGVGCTYDGAHVQFYQNGIGASTDLIAATGVFSYESVSALHVGTQLTSSTEYFTGQIATVYIWNRVLSPAEMAAVYAEPYRMFRPRLIQGKPWNAQAEQSHLMLLGVT